jgi:hypothetical protein
MDKELNAQKELERFYEDAFSMMSTQGWKDLMEDIERVKNSYDKLSAVTETHPLDFRRGQLDILNWLYGLKGLYEKAWEEIQMQEEESL